MTIPFSSIIEGDRARKDYGDLSGLKSSMQTVGQLHSIVLDQNRRLVYGGRRYRSMKELGVTELHEGKDGILEPGKFSYMLKENLTEDQLKEAELDENLYRLKPKWQEDALLIADVHEMKRKKEGHKWGQRQTAELLGTGYGLSNVNYALRVAKLLRKGDEQILQCATMMDAMSVLVKRKEDEAIAEATKRGAQRAASIGTGTGSFLDEIKISFQPLRKEGDVVLAPKISTQSTVVAPNVPGAHNADATFKPDASASPPIDIPLSKMFTCGECIVTDIPYGIDMDNLDDKQVADVKDEHDVNSNVKLMQPFLEQAFRLVKPSGFCVFFYDLDWHEYLQATAESIGWKVQRWPFVACKTSACKNQAPQYNTTKNYEVAMFLRRDEKTVLRKPVPSSWKMYDFAAERSLYNNPFAKPFELWKDIYEAISFPGQTVLDPFCGEMSACRAAVNCGLVPFGIELKEQHFNRGLEHMKAVYALLHKANVNFV
jgi:hypothetical protein